MSFPRLFRNRSVGRVDRVSEVVDVRVPAGRSPRRRCRAVYLEKPSERPGAGLFRTSILKTNDSNTNNRNRQNLVLYVKLFTLMGVTWIFEIVSWAVGGKNYYWLVIDCVNLLRGVFIFFIFCSKRSVLELVRVRLGCAPAQGP